MDVNDVCEHCGKEIHVPARAVRCEWGCCVWDEDAILAADEAMRTAFAKEVTMANAWRHAARPSHECALCSVETHRLRPVDLVRRAREGKPPIRPRYELVDGAPVRVREPRPDVAPGRAPATGVRGG